MNNSLQTQQTYQKFDQAFYIPTWIEAFLIDRKAQNLSPGSIRYYRQKLELFARYCEHQELTRIDQLSPGFIRQYLLYLEETGHNAGGIHSYYRCIKAFLRWYELEAEPEGWKNPIKKVKAPKVPEEIIDPVSLIDVSKMAATCKSGWKDARDKAMLLFMLDTGVRAGELLALNWEDIDQVTGAVSIKLGKGRKPRSVFLQRTARRALRAYAKTRSDKSPAVWITDEKERLKYDGLRALLKRRAERAGIPTPSAHDFRRAFALNMLRNGVDLITLARLMGHSSLLVLKRYLKQLDQDLQEAHAKGSPVEHGL